MKRFGTMSNFWFAVAMFAFAGIWFAVVMFAVLLGPYAQVAEAAAITSASDTMSSLKASPTTSTHAIKFTTPTGAGDATDTITTTFPADFNFTSKTIGTVTFTHGASTGAENTETLAASPSATAWGAAFSGTQNRIFTLTAPTDGIGAAVVAAGDKIIISFDGSNSINASAGTYVIAISGTFGDSGNITVQIITDDQVAVSSTVNQSLTFSLGSNTLALGTLSSTAAASSSHTFTVATNAASGMVTTVSGATLTSSPNTIDACAAGCTSTTGSEQFGINLKDNTTPNIGAEASGSAPIGVAATGYATADSFKFVTGATIASSAAGINSTVFTVSYLANISGATEAGSYTTTLTYTATATY